MIRFSGWVRRAGASARPLLLSALVLVVASSFPVHVPAGELSVEVTQGALSVNAVDVPLSDVLIAIGQRAQARILIESILESEVKERVTSSFAGLPMDEGLRRLLKRRSFMLGFGPGGVDEIRVYVDGATGFRDLTAAERDPVEPPAPSRRAGAAPEQRRGPDATAEDRVRLAQLRQVTLTSQDATARLEALEELAETQDTRYLLDAVIEALARERDAKVLEALLDLVQDRGPIPIAPLRTLVTSDRNGAARAQALELLADYAGADPGTRTLLQSLAQNDPSDRVRQTASSLLDTLQAPRPSPAPRPAPRTGQD